jgi:kinesin family protein C2/C3
MASTAASRDLEAGDVSPAGSRTRRESLSRWIARTTGHHLDARSDKGFCEGLWDGVVLCRVLQTLAPGVVADALRADDPRLRARDSPDTFLHRHNYEQFVAGAARVGVRDGDLFALRDLGGVAGSPGDVLRCLEAVRAAVGGANAEPSDPRETSTSRPVRSTSSGERAAATAADPAADPFAFSFAPRPDAETIAFETPPPTVHVPHVDFARLSLSTEEASEKTSGRLSGTRAETTSSTTSSRRVYSRTASLEAATAPTPTPSLALDSMEGFPGFVAADARSVNSRARARFDETPPATAARSAGSSFASPRSSSCSTVRREPERERRLDACERRLEDKERELVRERERLAEAFRREARASKNAKDAERRAEKAHAQADRLRRENEALRRSEKETFFLKRETKRVSATMGTVAETRETRRADASTTIRDENENENENEKVTLAARLAATARERDEAFRELEATRETLASAMRAATDAQTESRRVAARLLDTETALRDVRDTTVPSLRGALVALRRDAALARDAFSATFAERLFAATSRLAATSALYEKAAAENKKLHFAIQDLKGSIRVFCRVRPAVPGMDDERAAPAVAATTERDLVVTRRERRGEDAKLTRRSFSFDRAFGPAASQAEVYEACGPLIRCVADGYDVCLLAYGQTGSGKTHTMSGPPRGKRTFLRKTDEDAESSPSGLESLGVNYRALDDVFRVVRAREPVAEHVVTVSVLEIYNEECRDLLAQRGGTKIDVAGFGATNAGSERARNRAAADNVPDAVARVARDADDVFAAMREGEANRSVGATAMNARSSRSHSVVIVRVRAVSRETRSQTRGALYLVDLAGSERVARSEASGDRLKEARHINKSLSALGDVVAALQEKRAHVPYRNSKLTTLLRGALGPNGKAALFAHVSPAPASADESVRTLAFAERAAAVELGKPKRNVETEKTEKTETVSAPSEESARSRRDLAEMRARVEASEQRARDAERKLLGSVGSVGILDVSRASAGTSHRPASRIPTLPVSATYSRGKSRREISTTDDFRGLETPSSNEDASYFDEAIPNDAFSSDRVPYENENAKVSRDARERDEAELRRQAAAAAMSAAETTPPRLITHTDGDATFDHLLERQERREERSSSLDSENVRHRVANPRSVPLVPALSPLSALANASFADDTGSPGSGSSTGSGAFLVAASSAEDARADAPEKSSKSSSPRAENAAASAAASRWRSAYDSVAAAHETDSTRKKRSMYSRAAAAFGFAKKKPTARGRWQ